MDLQVKLQEAVDAYNDLLTQEQELEQQLLSLREQRLLAMGKVQALDELFKDEMRDSSIEASKNQDPEPE